MGTISDRTEELPFVSIVIPCRNEIRFIESCLDSIIQNDYPKNRLEVLVVDGMSDDGTRPIVEAFAEKYEYINLVDNSRKITPVALNTGIKRARGDVIMRMDAHSMYPKNYISGLVKWLEESGADNVGGACITKPADPSPVSIGIAEALSNPLAVGNAYFRIGTSKQRWVDTVPFGCYKRNVFDRIGLFDEELTRNQDGEFNHRLIKHGGKILLVPNVTSFYFARDSFWKLWTMYFQYGFFKPLVARKIGAIVTLRQIIPALFVISLFGFGILSIFHSLFFVLLAAEIATYLALILVGSLSMVWKKGLMCALAFSFAIPVMHFGHGLGYMAGIFNLFCRSAGKGIKFSKIPLSR